VGLLITRILRTSQSVGWQEEFYGETGSRTATTAFREGSGTGTPFLVEILIRDRTCGPRFGEPTSVVCALLCSTQHCPQTKRDHWVTGHLYRGDPRDAASSRRCCWDIGGRTPTKKNSPFSQVFSILNEGHSAFLTLELAREVDSNLKARFCHQATPRVRQRCRFYHPHRSPRETMSLRLTLLTRSFGASFEKAWLEYRGIHRPGSHRP